MGMIERQQQREAQLRRKLEEMEIHSNKESARRDSEAVEKEQVQFRLLGRCVHRLEGVTQ